MDYHVPGEYKLTATPTNRPCPDGWAVDDYAGPALEYIVKILEVDLEYPGLAEEDEDEPVGGLLCVNSDDDDQDGQTDSTQTSVAGEDDLQELKVQGNWEPLDTENAYWRVFWGSFNASVKIWRDQYKNTEIVLGQNYSDTIPSSLYVEGLTPGQGYVQLVVVDPHPKGTTCSDVVMLTIRDQLKPIQFDREPLTSCEPVTASMGAESPSKMIQWEIVNQPEGITIDPDRTPAGHQAKIWIDDPEKVTVHSITVRATAVDCDSTQIEGPDLCNCDSVERSLEVDLDGCSSDTCSVYGGGGAGNKSVYVWMSLGSGPEGRVGTLYLKESVPRQDLVAADSLKLGASKYATIREFAEEDPATYYRQIKVPEGLVQIVAADRTSGDFTVEFYTNDEAGAPDGAGHYSPGSPFRIWSFYGPVGNVLVQVNDGGTPAGTHEYTYSATNPRGWTLTQKQGNDVLRTVTRTDNAAQNRTETLQYMDGSNQVASIEQNIYYLFNWGEGLVEKRVATQPGQPDLVTQYEYYTDSAHRLKSVSRPDGSWSLYTYDGEGRKTSVASSWLDVTVAAAEQDPDLARLTTYSYAPPTGSPETAFVTERSQTPRVTEEKVEGNVVSRTYAAFYYSGQTNPDLVEVQVRDTDPSAGNGYADSDNLVTVTKYYSEALTGPEAGKVKSILQPDDRFTSYTYQKGNYEHANPDTTPGTFTPDSGGVYTRTIVTHGTESNPDGIANRTVREISVASPAGKTVLEAVEVYIGSSQYSRIDWTVHVYNGEGRLIDSYHQNGTFTSLDYASCCGALSETDTAGITTTSEHDAIGRLLSKVRPELDPVTVDGKSYDAQVELTTSYTHDAIGRELSAAITDGTLSQTTSQTYDWAGQVITSTGADQLVTQFDYATTGDGGRKVTRTLPGGAEEVTEYYRDGRVKSTTGTAVVNAFYRYGVESDGTQWTCAWRGDGGQDPDPASWTCGEDHDGAEWVETTTYDPLGRVKQVDKPGYNGATVTTAYFFNAAGQLEKTTTTGRAPTLYSYDALGEMEFTALDVDESDTIGVASDDRVTKSESAYEYDSGASSWYSVRKTIVYTDPDTQGNGGPITTSTVKQRLTGMASGTIEESYSYSANDLTVTHAWTTLDRTTHVIRRFSDPPDSTTHTEQVTRDGLLLASTSKTGVRTTFGYDGLMRRVTVTDPRTGATTTAYNALGQVESVEDAAEKVTTYAYYDDQSPMAGRLKSQTNALSKTQYFEYSPRGELLRTWGDTTYPVEYVYDALGRRTALRTFRTGEDWGDPDWATALGGNDPDETTWVYEPGTGLLLEKQYDGHDPQGPIRNIEYEYTDDGKLWKRRWSRTSGGNRILTTYGYSSATGELTSIAYSDSTPGVSFGYDRLGRHLYVSDAVGMHEMTYRPDLQPAAEDIYGALYSKLIQRRYEDGQGDTVAGRAAGLLVGYENEEDPPPDYKVVYAYDGQGRLNKVTGAGLDTAGVTYGFAQDSDLVETIAFNDSGGPAVSANFAYEDHRDLIASVENIRDPNGTPATISKYAYANDDIGRRTSVVMTGSAFSSSRHWRWEYNERSELTWADQCDGADLQATCSRPTLYGFFGYEYDPIGNRTEILSDDVGTVAYTTNELNQYTEIGIQEEPQYDADGNLIEDIWFVYTWDGENRLIGVETRLEMGASPTAHEDDDVKLEFKYDYMNRRVEKTLWTYNSGWGSPTQVLRFVYDRWNVVLVLNGLDDNAVLTKYTWGLDLSGQRGNPTVEGIHGAGGIGGLLAVEETAESGTPKYWFLYDANGNVGQIVKNTTSPSNYPLTGHYEYDAYGNVILASNADSSGYVNTNPFRFSTKWFDAESRLHYYGYRYLGRERWLSRDPIQEAAGSNMYKFIKSNPINRWDPVGLWEGSCCCVHKFFDKQGVLGTENIIDKSTGIAHGQRVYKSFDIFATFKTSQSCRPSCCEYRQYVRARAVIYPAQDPVNPIVFDEGEFLKEDCEKGRCYGHRRNPRVWYDQYTPNQTTGEVYSNHDEPGVIIGRGDKVEGVWYFRGVIIDTCRANAERAYFHWRIIIHYTVPDPIPTK